MGRYRWVRRLAVLTSVLLLGAAAPALADGTATSGQAAVDQAAGTISVEAGSSVRAEGGGDGGGGSDAAPYVGNETTCRAPLGGGTDQGFCEVAPLPGLGPVVDPQELATQARNTLALPAPDIRLNPAPPQDQLVNLATWMWLANWAPANSQASVPGVTVTVTAQPDRVIWDMGNGEQVVCAGPGTPYDMSRPEEAQHSDCTYTYRRSSAGRPNEAYVITATVEWSASWAVAGAPGGGSLPGLRRSSSVPVRVAEIQAINVESSAR